MSFTMKFDTRELDSWIRNQPNRDRARKQAMTLMKNELIDETKRELSLHTSTGELENSVMGTATDRKLEIFSNMYGGIVLEYGRKPGRFPPVEPLQRWAELHGMGKGAGYLIARKIARSGTEKYRRRGPKQLTAIQERFNRDILPMKMVTLLNEYTK